MPGVKVIDITYGLTLAATGFRKIAADDGSPRPLYTSHDGSVTSYLWVNSTSNSHSSITDIRIIYDDEPIPDNYELINKNIWKGLTSSKAFLCICREPNLLGISTR
jgi:hypothetical protein